MSLPTCSSRPERTFDIAWSAAADEPRRTTLLHSCGRCSSRNGWPSCASVACSVESAWRCRTPLRPCLALPIGSRRCQAWQASSECGPGRRVRQRRRASARLARSGRLAANARATRTACPLASWTGRTMRLTATTTGTCGRRRRSPAARLATRTGTAKVAARPTRTRPTSATGPPACQRHASLAVVTDVRLPRHERPPNRLPATNMRWVRRRRSHGAVVTETVRLRGRRARRRRTTRRPTSTSSRGSCSLALRRTCTDPHPCCGA
mmetsp:Transcript_8797/g.28076  ORF Transcript_8797/g.28076 Transcript_8797/m.28076 type:complete len:265 (+) Transcript_8797:339-1133(+)